MIHLLVVLLVSSLLQHGVEAESSHISKFHQSAAKEQNGKWSCLIPVTSSSCLCKSGAPLTGHVVTFSLTALLPPLNGPQAKTVA